MPILCRHNVDNPSRMVKLTRDLRKLLRCTAAALAPVLSTTVLAWKPPPGLPVLLRSDASGPDGFGCHVGEEALAGPGSSTLGG